MPEHRRRAHALFVEGKIADAIAVMAQALGPNPERPAKDDLKFLAHLQFAKGDVPAALKFAHAAHEVAPDDGETLKNIGVCYIRLRQEREAVAWLEKAIALDARDAAVHDTLCHAYGNLGDMELAKHHGERALVLKDEGMARAKPVRRAADVSIPPFRGDRPERNVIAFSLWGDRYRYCRGAVENARLAPELYPGWRCRFYCDGSVPSATVGELISLGADVVMMPDDQRLHEGLFWRFNVCWDESVDRYLIRDADSVINVKERAAVDAWLDSDRHFHVMRDFHTHTDLILAGMWGGVAKALPNLRRHADRYLDDIAKPKTCDQNFLREVVWPVVRQSYLLHDSVFEVLGAQPYPSHAVLPAGRHIGQNAEAHPKPAPGTVRTMDASARTAVRPPRRRFVFTVTTGRSGTSYLAELLRRNLPAAEVHHERTGFRNLGVETPDASHFTLFNSAGNVPEVETFWRRKLASARYGAGDTYVETSHYLAKAGLIENLGWLGGDSEVHLIRLRRDPESVVWSFANRMDFANRGFTWLFTLDPAYPRNIVNRKPFARYGMIGSCYWYVVEMAVRGAYYRRLLEPAAHIHVHDVDLEEIATADGAARLLSVLGSDLADKDVDLPERENAMRQQVLADKDRVAISEMAAKLPFDASALADRFIETGRRIG